MKTKGAKIFTAIVVIATIAIICGLIYSYNLEKSQTPEGNYNCSELIRSCLQVMTCFIASLSLVFTIDSRAENIIMRKSNRKTELELEWFKSIVIERHLDSLFEFFSFTCSIVDIFNDVNTRQTTEDMKHSQYLSDIKSKVVSPFTEKYIQVQQPLISDASIIDNALADNLKSAFNSFQDEFTSYIQNTEPNYEQMKNMVLENQKIVVKILRDYNMNIVK